MLSKWFTLSLVILASVVGGLACIQLFFHQDDLGKIFGTPPRQAGDVLYENFDPGAVHTVVISKSSGERAEFVRRKGIWRMVDPKQDRADYAILQTIIYFSRHLQVEDVIRRKDITLEEAGMRASGTYGGRYNITLKDRTQNTLANYRLGRRTAWHRLNDKDGTLIETFFVRPAKGSMDDHIYICSAPEKLKISVRQTLDRGLSRLRDHHPLLFNQQGIADITIRAKGREIVLSRPDPDSPAWKMTKPLEARTKPEMINGLIVGLAQLEAIRIHDLKSVTIPPRPPGEFLVEVELRHFGSDGSRGQTSDTLTIEPPSPPDADTVLASIEARPDLVFEIPLNPVTGSMTLSQLPLEVDQLRERTLTSLDIATLKSMTIHQFNDPGLIHVFLGVERSGQARWMLNQGGDTAPANEAVMARVLQAISLNEVIGFASNAASNLSRYGLSPPAKRIILDLREGDPIDLFFGRGVNGRFYAMRHGSSAVAEIDAATYTSIATRPYQWRDSLLMPFSIVDLSIMKIEKFPFRVPLADPALTLKYKFLSEDWEARQFDEDVSAGLNKHRANQFIKFMESLRVERWLDESTPAAIRALREPTFRFTAVFRELDGQGDLKGFREASFDLAPANRSPRNRIFYGKLKDDPHYFVLSMDSYHQLSTPLMDTGKP
jgi:hypothetical protein